MLREADLHLPKSRVGTDRPFGLGIAGRAGLDRRGHRPPGTRPEAPRRQRDPHHPHPPVLVRRLRAHIKRFGTTLDGRVFQTARGGILQDSGYNEVWDAGPQGSAHPRPVPVAARPPPV